MLNKKKKLQVLKYCHLPNHKPHPMQLAVKIMVVIMSMSKPNLSRYSAGQSRSFLDKRPGRSEQMHCNAILQLSLYMLIQTLYTWVVGIYGQRQAVASTCPAEPPMSCTALHCTALHCTALHCTALYTVHCTVYSTGYCTVMYTVQHCIGLIQN